MNPLFAAFLKVNRGLGLYEVAILEENITISYSKTTSVIKKLLTTPGKSDVMSTTLVPFINATEKIDKAVNHSLFC